MIKKDDIVRIVDGAEVLEGRVTSTFESNGVEYVTVGTRVYTSEEVTKVPNQSPAIDAEQFMYPEAVNVTETDQVARVKEIVDAVLVAKAEKGIDKYGETLDKAALSETHLIDKAIDSAVGVLIYLTSLKEAE